MHQTTSAQTSGYTAALVGLQRSRCSRLMCEREDAIQDHDHHRHYHAQRQMFFSSSLSPQKTPPPFLEETFDDRPSPSTRLSFQGTRPACQSSPPLVGVRNAFSALALGGLRPTRHRLGVETKRGDGLGARVLA